MSEDTVFPKYKVHVVLMSLTWLHFFPWQSADGALRAYVALGALLGWAGGSGSHLADDDGRLFALDSLINWRAPKREKRHRHLVAL